MSSRAYLVDKINAIEELTALADHLRESIRASEYESKMEPDSKGKRCEEILKKVNNLRRKLMRELGEEADSADPKMWCHFKHAASADMKLNEVYEATFDENDLSNMVEMSDIMASIITMYLGMQFEDCSRCLYDEMLIEQNSKKRGENSNKRNGIEAKDKNGVSPNIGYVKMKTVVKSDDLSTAHDTKRINKHMDDKLRYEHNVKRADSIKKNDKDEQYKLWRVLLDRGEM